MDKENSQVVNVDSGELELNNQKPLQSANALFRFFDKPKYLYTAISNAGLAPRYYSEDVEYMNIEAKRIAYPMICFCDINLHKLGEHIEFYGGGGYGIAFAKEWGEKKGIQPIQYINSKSILCNDLSEAFNFSLSSEYEDFAQNFLLTQMYFVKPIRGIMPRKEDIPKIFTDECEWRYIPNLKTLELPQAVADENLVTLDVWNKIIEAHNEVWLNFNYDDIKYLFIKSDEDFDDICNVIEKNVSDEKAKRRLISKIIIWENERSDF